MRIVPFLLRLLLCVSLVANGLAVAQASTRMHLVPRAMAADAPAASMAPAGCHEAMQHAVAEADPVDDAIDRPGSMATECCDGDACPCSCVAQAYLAIGAGAAPPPAAVQRERGVPDGLPRHFPPRLAHLIRPPIG